ncbi:MAG TPA: TetR/AcrR family transcriptional regulator [Cellulomonas sp.]
MTSRKDQILATALALADESGLEAVTMRAVAARVGITPMALYRHVADKEALLDGVLETAFAEAALPDARLPWDERLTSLAAEVRAIGHRHPTALGLAFSRPGDTPGVRRLVGAIHEVFAEAGVPERQWNRLERMVSTFVVGFVVSEVSGRFPRDVGEYLAREYAADVADLLGLVRAAASPEQAKM